VNKKRLHKFHIKRFNFKKLSKVQGEEQSAFRSPVGLHLIHLFWLYHYSVI
jgi:hypothetical protein